MALTPKQAQFVMEYIIDLNGTQAAIRSGYSEDSARLIACENLTKPDIKDAIKEQLDARAARTLITADRVLHEMKRAAFVDIRKLFNEDGTTKKAKDLDDDTAAAIAGIEVTYGDGYTTHKYKLADKNKSLENLAKHLGLNAPEKVDLNANLTTRTLDSFYGEP